MRLFPVILLPFLLTSSCSDHAGKEIDTPTSGSIAIGADVEYMPVTRAEITVFEALYVKAKILPVFTTEDSAFGLLLKDSVRLIVASRKLLPKEESLFNAEKLYPEQMKIATDAIAFIVNSDNPDTLLTIPRLKRIFAGQDSLWQQVEDSLSPADSSNQAADRPAYTGSKINPGAPVQVVFDYENSGSSRYIVEHLTNGGKLPHYCYALHGNNEVINYVSRNRNALGIIGVNWVSDRYDTSVIRYLKAVHLVALSAKDHAAIGDYYQPTSENMQAGAYPLCRDVYIISREAYTGLGSGFFSFVTSNRGQRIIYRDGLAPYHALSHTVRF